MAKTFTAPFAQTPKTATAVATGAATVDDDAPANAELLLTAGPEGAILSRLTAVPRATVTASCLALYTSTDGGTTKRLLHTVLMGAHTVATTTAIPSTDFGFSDDKPMRLEAGAELYVGTCVALTEGIVFTAEYMDF